MSKSKGGIWNGTSRYHSAWITEDTPKNLQIHIRKNYAKTLYKPIQGHNFHPVG